MNKAVILDAGHGGVYPGTANEGYIEKDLMLYFTLIAKELFEEAGVTVLLTRNRDVSMELIDRTNLENEQRPDCFISFHLDGAPTESACGPTVWLHTNAPKEYEQWGRNILDGLYKVGITTNRSKDLNKGMPGNVNINYYVNQHTKGPSMLLELGFLTSDVNLMEFLEKHRDYAKAVVNATCRFLGVNGLPENETANNDDRVQELEQQINDLTYCLAQAITERDKAFSSEKRIKQEVVGTVNKLLTTVQ